MPEHDVDRLGLTYRSLAIRQQAPESIDVEKRTVEVIGATEAMVEVWDYERWETIREVLLMSGCELPASKQVPVFDTHKRYDTNTLLGSYRDMRTEQGMLLGSVHFSAAPEAQGPWTKVQEGHLTDFSVGYRVLKAVWIPEGETAVVEGRTFEGPVRVATSWKPRELSAVPIGADEFAKARSQHDNGGARKMAEKTEQKVVEIPAGVQVPNPQEVVQRAEQKVVDIDQERAAAAIAERGRVREIQAMCLRFDLADLAETLINDGATVDHARTQVMDRLMKAGERTPYRAPVTVEQDERDKFRVAAQDAILIRANFKLEKPALGALDLAGYSLRELARHALKLAGRPTGGNPLEMVGRALTTSDFPYILANVANKSLFEGFDGASETWRVWCGTGQVADFKTHYSPRIGEFSALEEIPEDTEYKYGKRTEAQESYQIATYGKIFPISRQVIINDDLGAIIRNSAGMGESAARLIGDVAYAVLTANANMGDGVALFDNATHANLAAGGNIGTPGIATLAEAIRAMKNQKDLQGLRRLNIRPEFFIAPITMEGASEVFFRSERFSDANTAATDSSMASTQVNPYSGSYLTRVYEPRLDDSSTKYWYLAGPKNKTVVLFFLNGVERPYFEERQGWTVDGVEYKVRIDCGAKAMDYRGLYCNPDT